MDPADIALELDAHLAAHNGERRTKALVSLIIGILAWPGCLLLLILLLLAVGKFVLRLGGFKSMPWFFLAIAAVYLAANLALLAIRLIRKEEHQLETHQHGNSDGIGDAILVQAILLPGSLTADAVNQVRLLVRLDAKERLTALALMQQAGYRDRPHRLREPAVADILVLMKLANIGAIGLESDADGTAHYYRRLPPAVRS